MLLLLLLPAAATIPSCCKHTAGPAFCYLRSDRDGPSPRHGQQELTEGRQEGRNSRKEGSGVLGGCGCQGLGDLLRPSLWASRSRYKAACLLKVSGPDRFKGNLRIFRPGFIGTKSLLLTGLRDAAHTPQTREGRAVAIWPLGAGGRAGLESRLSEVSARKTLVRGTLNSCRNSPSRVEASGRLCKVEPLL